MASNLQQTPQERQAGYHVQGSDLADSVAALSTGSSRATNNNQSLIPSIFTEPPPIKDSLPTHTSRVQDSTVRECLPWLLGTVLSRDDIPFNEYGVPHLDRRRHVRFLQKQLGRLPSAFIAADASRPWFLYWSLNGLALMGEDVSSYRQSLADTAHTMQNATGGFGGGNGQTSHLATTYAIILALTIVGGEDAYEVVDRKAMWRWLCSLKQLDGGFQMAYGGEVDVR
jgi:protein farnesyltransferase subunit beta